MSSYLIDARGKSVADRTEAALWAFGALGGSCVLGVLGIVTMFASPKLGIVVVLLAGVLFIASPIQMWRYILRGDRALRAAVTAWQAGQRDAVLAPCHEVLRTVFRADLRARAFHLLGLVAESDGAFGPAIECFHHARASLPAMAAPVRKRYVEILIGSHAAMCKTAIGDLQGASLELGAALHHLHTGDQKSTIDHLTDDGDWGLGTVSMNESLMRIEGGRPPHALFALASALHALRAGDPHAALSVLGQNYAFLDQGLGPREQLVRAAIEHHALTRVGQPSRGAPPESPWLRALVGA